MKSTKPKTEFKNLITIDRVYFTIISIIRLTLILAIINAIYNQRWTVLFVSSLTLILTFLPTLFEKRYKIYIPIEFEIITILFIFSSLFLGEVHGYYTRLWWWDLLLHTGSALALGFIGFTILYILYKGQKIKANPITVAVFSFFFALGMGALWEIFEFSMDQIFGYNMQKSGLIDTMWDLIVDAVGAFIASLLGFIYLKKGEVFIFDKLIKRFVKENPNLFQNN